MTNNMNEKPYDRALRLSDGETLIVTNGSKWAGSDPDGIDTFKEVLTTHTLCPRFFQYSLYLGSPWQPMAADVGALEKWRNAHSFFGNFFSLSHGFNIITLSNKLANELNSLIAKNVQSEEFINYASELYADFSLAHLNGNKFLLEPNLAVSAQKGNKSAFTGSHYYKRDCVVIEPFSRKVITDLLIDYDQAAQ